MNATWIRFEAKLHQCVRALEEDDVLIIARTTANQFVQLRQVDSEICVVEAASNAYIVPPTALLDQRQYDRACALGWRRPDASAEQVESGEATGSPNFHFVFHSRTPRIARMLVDTLRSVYGVRTLRELEYHSFKGATGAEVRWPTLGIARIRDVAAAPDGGFDADADDADDDAF